MKYPFNYLLKIQYLGFRFHGWQKQPGLKTVHHMIERTIQFVLEEQSFKILGGARTDAMVSAHEYYVQLFMNEAIPSIFLENININLPNDIRLLAIDKISSNFNIIQDVEYKEYHYLFSFGEKQHPFCAPFMCNILDSLNINKMIEAADLYTGTYDFINYVKKPKKDIESVRTVLSSKIEKNTAYQANFFPKNSYVFKIKSNGFMRNQVRIMMGVLFEIGKGNMSILEFKQTFINRSNPEDNLAKYMGSASGLILKEIMHKKRED